MKTIDYQKEIHTYTQANRKIQKGRMIYCMNKKLKLWIRWLIAVKKNIQAKKRALIKIEILYQ